MGLRRSAPAEPHPSAGSLCGTRPLPCAECVQGEQRACSGPRLVTPAPAWPRTSGFYLLCFITGVAGLPAWMAGLVLMVMSSRGTASTIPFVGWPQRPHQAALGVRAAWIAGCRAMGLRCRQTVGCPGSLCQKFGLLRGDPPCSPRGTVHLPVTCPIRPRQRSPRHQPAHPAEHRPLQRSILADSAASARALLVRRTIGLPQHWGSLRLLIIWDPGLALGSVAVHGHASGPPAIRAIGTPVATHWRQWSFPAGSLASYLLLWCACS